MFFQSSQVSAESTVHTSANKAEEKVGDVRYSTHSIDEVTGEEVDTLRGKYIRRLTAVLIHHIPAFWKVALSVFSGKFAKVDWMLSFFLDFGASHYFARVTFKLWFKKYTFLGHMVHYIYACPFLLQWIWGASFQFSSA